MNGSGGPPAGLLFPAPGVGPGCGWQLTLFVAGGHDRSRRAIENLRHLCAAHLPPDAEVEVVDIYRAPDAALRQGIMVAPTLLRETPLPVRRVVGDLSDTAAVLRGLDLAADRYGGG